LKNLLPVLLISSCIDYVQLYVPVVHVESSQNNNINNVLQQKQSFYK